VQHHGTIIAGFNAPSASVAFVFVNSDCTCFLRLGQRFAWAGSYACWFFAEPAGNSHVNNLILAYYANAGFNWIEGFFFGI
jgi:hypothetical protein